MDVKKLTGWTGVGLIIFGAILIVLQVFMGSLLGASLKMLTIGLVVLFYAIGAILLITAGLGRGRSK